jgi:tRNA threonylcarbamoyl adenosine modification protein YjeE
MNIYTTEPRIYHFDFYRLEGGDQTDFGLDDYLEREGIAFIEWPQQNDPALPEEALVIEIKLSDEDYDLARQVRAYGIGEKYREKAEKVMQFGDPGDR